MGEWEVKHLCWVLSMRCKGRWSHAGRSSGLMDPRQQHMYQEQILALTWTLSWMTTSVLQMPCYCFLVHHPRHRSLVLLKSQSCSSVHKLSRRVQLIVQRERTKTNKSIPFRILSGRLATHASQVRSSRPQKEFSCSAHTRCLTERWFSMSVHPGFWSDEITYP
jgi:hypothetical protein